jgi:hypothetical protein
MDARELRGLLIFVLSWELGSRGNPRSVQPNNASSPRNLTRENTTQQKTPAFGRGATRPFLIIVPTGPIVLSKRILVERGT